MNMAGEAVKVRLVRCPKCRKVLTEFANFPVYKCGECGTVLQAKYCNASMKRTTSETVAKNPAPKDELKHDSDDKESIFSRKQFIRCSTDSYASDLNCQRAQSETGGCHKKGSESSNVIYSSNELDCHGKEESFEAGEHGEAEKSRSSDVVSSSNELDCQGKEESFAAGENGEAEENRSSDVISSSNELDSHGKEELFTAGENGEAEESEGRGSNFGSPVTSQMLSEQNIQPKTDIYSLAECVEESQELFFDAGENGETEASEGRGSNFGSPVTSQMLSEQNIQPKMDNYSLAECVGESQELGQRGIDIRSQDKREETEESVNQCVMSEEDMVKTKFSESPATRSSHAYYGSVSSLEDGNDYNVSNRRLHSPKRTLCEPLRVSEPTKGRPTRDNILGSNRMSTESEVQFPARKFSSVSSKGKHNLAFAESVNWDQGESSKPTRYGIYAKDHGDFHNSEGFRSVLKWMESKEDGPSKFRSRDPHYQRELPSVYQNGSSSNYRHEELLQRPNLHASDNFELLRKVDELRDQLTYGQRGKPNGRFPIRSTQQGNQWPLHYDNEPEEEFQQFYSGNYTRHPPGVYRPRIVPPQCSGFSQIPFSGQTTNCRRHVDYSSLYSYPEDWRLPMQVPPSICYNKGVCRACPGHRSYNPYSPSCSSPVRSADSNFPPGCHTAQPHEERLTEYEVEKFYYKKKHLVVKRHCRPIAGGAPFIICCNCLKSLQLPTDFLLSRRKCHKLRCGACTEILKFSLCNGIHIVPYSCSHTQIETPLSDGNNVTDAASIRSRLSSTSHVNDCLQGDVTSYSEEYGLSIRKSYSTEGEPALSIPQAHILQRNLRDKRHASNSSPDAMKERTKTIPEKYGNKSSDASELAKSEKSSSEAKVPPSFMGSPLHRLMGYSSPSEVINGSGFLGEGSESTDLQIVGNSCVGSEENLGSRGLKENELRSPRHKDSESGTCQDNKEVFEEYGLLNMSRDTRNSFLTESMNKEKRELSKGSEKMKYSVHVNGRVIPDQLLDKAEEKAGPIQPGNYWYDSRAGFWGVMGQPCLGILPPFIKEFNHLMKKDCAGGDTGILVNGRELHHEDLNMLSILGLPTTKNKVYCVDFNGKVIEEATGEELESLGPLAPTVAKEGVGFGMLVPPSAAVD